MPTTDTVLVVPTIRENSFNDFLRRWDSIGLFQEVDLIVVEDNPTRTFQIPHDLNRGGERKLNTCHISWKDIEDPLLGPKQWIVPRRSDTVRSAGYLEGWRRDYKYIMTLDDDCYPCSEKDGVVYDGRAFIAEHKKNLDSRSRWFNTLNDVKPRGIPFYNVGRLTTTVVNHGLWTNVLDYDAPYQLANPIKEKHSFDNRLVPNGMYFPMCGMNVMWKAEVTVLMYHLLMGQAMIDPKTYYDGTDDYRAHQRGLLKLPFDRFGDIWCGIFMKKIVDDCGMTVSTGMPYIRHERASNPFTNLKKEANGLEVNEKLWDYVDWFDVNPKKALNEIYADLGVHVSRFREFPEYDPYFKVLGNAMVEWASLFKEK